MSILLHEYNAVKRREYYLRTRHLVGRKKVMPVAKAPVKALVKKAPVKKTHAQRQKELAAQVARLQAKLDRLQAALKILVEAAQKRSGIDKNTAEKAALSKNDKPTSDPTSKYVKKTQKQKDAAAKAARKYQDENQVLEEKVSDLNKKIKAIRERIKRIQQTGSVGVRNSHDK